MVLWPNSIQAPSQDRSRIGGPGGLHSASPQEGSHKGALAGLDPGSSQDRSRNCDTGRSSKSIEVRGVDASGSENYQVPTG